MKPRDIALALAAPILWGVGFTFAKPALQQFPPMLMMLMIYVATAAVLLVRRRRLRTPLWAVLVIGAGGGAVQSILIFSGLSDLPASTAVLVVQSQVPFAVLSAWVIGKERLSAARLVGIAIAIGGVALIAGAPEATSDYPSLVLVVLGALVWAAAQALIRTFGRDDGPTTTGMIALVSAPLALAGSLLFESGQWESVQTAAAAELGRTGRGVPLRLSAGLLGLVSGPRQVSRRPSDAVHSVDADRRRDHGRPGARRRIDRARTHRRGHHPRRAVDRGSRRSRAGASCRGRTLSTTGVAMALALISKLEDAELWRREMTAAIPGLDFRVWPELGDERQIRMAAFDFNLTPPGIFQRMPSLGCIVYLGHGANDFLQRPDLPKGVPVMRLKDPGIIGYMVEYVLLYLLSHRRSQATYQRQQIERRWEIHIPSFPGEVRVAVLGLGSIGQRFAQAFASLGYQVHGWSRGPHDLPGVACYHGGDQLAACLGPCDYVVCVLPETSETRDIINAETLALMKRGAYFINVGRGRLVVEADLLAALDSGQAVRRRPRRLPRRTAAAGESAMESSEGGGHAA